MRITELRNKIAIKSIYLFINNNAIATYLWNIQQETI